MPFSMLYITYDGLLDPLGSSQILPYLESIASHPRSVHIISFEKPERLQAGEINLRKRLKVHSINWTPLSFTIGLGLMGKIWDLIRMYLYGFLIALKINPKIIHTRGHAAAQVGFLLKRWMGLKLIFDFRGLWVDERVDKGSWDLGKIFHRLQYQHYKKIEKELLHHADQIVVLTDSVVDEVVRLGAQSVEKITVIPCCADFEHFPLATVQRRAEARDRAGIQHDARVLGYLGSVGRMYMLDHFFRLFELAAAQRKDVRALVITQDLMALKKLMDSALPSELHSLVHIISASRNEVPDAIAAMDLLISFIQPSYARMAASPTKLAECFAEGVPAICNAGVGDVAEQIQQLQAGVIVDPKSADELLIAINRLDEISAMGGLRLREASRTVLGLEVAIARYQSVYSKLD
jgi:glycosyltransferase involved in cell wall biosynthesis